MNEFTWEIYLESCNAPAAPKNLFKSQNSVSCLVQILPTYHIQTAEGGLSVKGFFISSKQCLLQAEQCCYFIFWQEKSAVECPGSIFVSNLDSFTPGVKKICMHFFALNWINISCALTFVHMV